MHCCGWIELRAADETAAGDTSMDNREEELPGLPPELTEEFPEELMDLLAELQPGAWQTLFSVSTALGYQENVGLSSVAPVKDSFGQLRVEGLVMRQPLNGWQWLAILDGQSRWFQGNPITKDQHFWFARGEGRWTPWAPLQFTGAVQGFWQDQVIDLTEGIGARTVADLQVAGAEASFGASLNIWGGFTAEAVAQATRLDYRGAAEDYEALKYQAELAWSLWEPLTLAVGGSEGGRDYDFRNETTKGGRLLVDTILSYTQATEYARAELEWTWAGDWALGVKVSRFENRDEAAGFYDYDRERWGASLGWERGNWAIRGEWEEQDLAYTLQTVGAGLTPEGRTQEDGNWQAELRYTWGEHWEIIGEINGDRSLSNEVDSSYRDRSVLIGAVYTF